MGFFSKIKNQLGIGGVQVILQMPGQAEKAKSFIEGKLILTTKSEQFISDITVKMIENFTTGRGESKSTKQFDLGVMKIPGGFNIKPGEQKEIPFNLPFSILKTNADELKEIGGTFGTIGKMASFANNEISEYFVNADVDVKNVALDPSDRKQIKLI